MSKRTIFYRAPFRDSKHHEYIPIRANEISSTQIKDLIFIWGSFLDSIESILRWLLIPFDDLPKNHGHPADMHGSVLDIASQHHVTTGSIFLGIFAFCGLAGIYYSYEQQYQAKLRDLQEKTEEEEKTYSISYAYNLSTLKLKSKDTLISELNTHLGAILASQNNKFAGFKRAKFVEDEEAATVKLTFESDFSIARMIAAGWNALFIAAFLYWLGWFTTGVYYGSLCLAGFTNCSSLVSYGVPALGGALYLGVKIFHWFRHRDEECLPTFEERTRADELLKLCLDRLEKTVGAISQVHPTKFFDKHQDIIKLNLLRIVSAFLINAVEKYSVAQYIFWYLGDFTGKLASCTDPVAITCFIFAAIAGFVYAINKYNEIANTHFSVNDLNAASQNEALYTSTRKSINKEKNALQMYNSLIGSLARTIGQLIENPHYQRFANFIGGFYIARVFVFTCTSSYVPSFFHLTQSLAVLSNPAVWLILFGTALAWVIIKEFAANFEKKATMHRSVAEAIAELKQVKELVTKESQLAKQENGECDVHADVPLVSTVAYTEKQRFFRPTEREKKPYFSQPLVQVTSLEEISSGDCPEGLSMLTGRDRRL